MDGHLIQCCLQQEISHFLAKDVVNRGTIRSTFEIGKMAQVVKSNKVFTTMIEGLTEGSLGTSTTCYGTRYHARNISWYHYTIFLDGTKISTGHFLLHLEKS